MSTLDQPCRRGLHTNELFLCGANLKFYNEENLTDKLVFVSVPVSQSSPHHFTIDPGTSDPGVMELLPGRTSFRNLRLAKNTNPSA